MKNELLGGKDIERASVRAFRAINQVLSSPSVRRERTPPLLANEENEPLPGHTWSHYSILLENAWAKLRSKKKAPAGSFAFVVTVFCRLLSLFFPVYEQKCPLPSFFLVQ